LESLVLIQKIKEMKTKKKKKRNRRLSGSLLIIVANPFSFDISRHPCSSIID
jgi:hypothetical protein